MNLKQICEINRELICDAKTAMELWEQRAEEAAKRDHLKVSENTLQDVSYNNKKRERIMGLDFSHCNAHWSYSGFNRFRTKLAFDIGISLNSMEGFSGDDNSPNIPWKNIDHQIIPLLNHSDCDGELSPEECKEIIPALKKIITSWEDDDYDKKQAILLIGGMENAIKNNESLTFT